MILYLPPEILSIKFPDCIGLVSSRSVFSGSLLIFIGLRSALLFYQVKFLSWLGHYIREQPWRQSLSPVLLWHCLLILCGVWPAIELVAGWHAGDADALIFLLVH